MKSEYTLNTKADVSACFCDLENRFDAGEKLVVTVKTDNRTRRQLLTGLYWHFLGQVCKHTGHDKQEAHDNAKRQFLIPIYARDSERHPDHKDVLKNMGIIKRDMPEMFENMAALVIEGTHLEDADESEMSEYIKCVEQQGISLGVKFQLSRHEKELWGEV